MQQLSKRFWLLLEDVCENIELVHVSKITDFEEYGKSYDCYVLTNSYLATVKVVESDQLLFPSEIIHRSDRKALGEKFIQNFFENRNSIKCDSDSQNIELVSFEQLVLDI